MIYVGEGGRERERGPQPLPGLKGLKRRFDGRWRKAKPTGEGGKGGEGIVADLEQKTEWKERIGRCCVERRIVARSSA